ncbi:MAG: hypothetical protein Q9199_006624 [Rusavskia elegans]
MTLPYENDEHGDLNGQPHSSFDSEKRWLLDAFGILARVTDFARKDCAGKSTLHLLADMWQKSDLTLSTTMMNIAMDKVLLADVPQSLCNDPSYTIKALTIADEELAYKFLKHFPNVDAVAGDLSIIKAACLNGCSSKLLQDLLSRSKIQRENKQISGVVRAACLAKAAKSTHRNLEVLISTGLDPNDRCPSSGETPLMIVARDGKTELMKILLSSGADIHALNRDGCNVTHFACMGGFLGILQILQQITIDWSSRGSGWIVDGFFTGLSPLHLAAIHESSYALEFLLDENLVTDIDVVTDRSFTALSLAAWRARPQNISLLLFRDADPTIKSFRGETALQIAIRMGDEAVIRVFLQYNRDLDLRGLDYGILLAKKYRHSSAEKMLKEYKEDQGKHLHPVLLKQMTYGMLTVEVILSGRQPNPASRTSIDSFSTSRMLQDAIDLADIELCKRLIDEGASLSIGFDGCGCSPLLYLLHQSPLGKDKIEMAEFLATRDASIEGVVCQRWSHRGSTVFHYAADFAYTKLLQVLLDKHLSSFFELDTLIHPLHLAVLKGHYECAQLIIHYCQREYEINVLNCSPAPTPAGDLIECQVARSLPQAYQDQRHDFLYPTIFRTATPLIIAAHKGHIQIARLLLESGASPNTTDKIFLTPLHLAALSDQTAMTELLLDQGANVHALDRWLRTPSMVAAGKGCWASLQVLKARGADFQMRDMSGKTVLHYAAEPPNTFIIPVLVLAGDENLGIEDCMGLSPLAYVLYRGDWRTILSILNFAPKLGDYDLHAVNILSVGVSNLQMSTSLLKKFLRRLSPSIVTILLKHRAQAIGTPLYVASTVTTPSQQEGFISLLLEAGADLEQLGGEHGTPLMGACAAGRLRAVKLLVGKGARLCYEGDDGLISALHAARHFPEIVRWLFVERFTHGPRRILSTFDG